MLISRSLSRAYDVHYYNLFYLQVKNDLLTWRYGLRLSNPPPSFRAYSPILAPILSTLSWVLRPEAGVRLLFLAASSVPRSCRFPPQWKFEFVDGKPFWITFKAIKLYTADGKDLCISYHINGNPRAMWRLSCIQSRRCACLLLLLQFMLPPCLLLDLQVLPNSKILFSWPLPLHFYTPTFTSSIIYCPHFFKSLHFTPEIFSAFASLTHCEIFSIIFLSSISSHPPNSYDNFRHGKTWVTSHPASLFSTTLSHLRPQSAPREVFTLRKSLQEACRALSHKRRLNEIFLDHLLMSLSRVKPHARQDPHMSASFKLARFNTYIVRWS